MWSRAQGSGVKAVTKLVWAWIAVTHAILAGQPFSGSKQEGSSQRLQEFPSSQCFAGVW